MIKINDSCLLEILQETYGFEREEFSEKEISEIKEIFLDSESFVDTDLNDLVYFTNVEKIVLKDLFVNRTLLNNICNINVLKEVSFYNCNIGDIEMLSKTKIVSLVIDNCIYENLFLINSMTNLKELYLDNNDLIDLKELTIIKRLEKLSLNNAQVINDDYFIYMNEIEYLAISDSGIDDISILLSMDKLKVLVLDEKQARLNKDFVMELRDKNVKVIDLYNRDVVMYYE